MVVLLRTLEEARECYGAPSTGEGVRLMPSMYNEGSYAELELHLARLRCERRQIWWHTCQRYRWGRETTRVVKARNTKAGVLLDTPGDCELAARPLLVANGWARVRVYRWDSRVDMTLAAAGVADLAEHMHGGRWDCIELPQLLYPTLQAKAA